MGYCLIKEKVCKLVCPECEKLHQIPTRITYCHFHTKSSVIKKYDEHDNNITQKVNTCTRYY